MKKAIFFTFLLLLQIISLWNNFSGLYPEVYSSIFAIQIFGIIWNVVLTFGISMAIISVIEEGDD